MKSAPANKDGLANCKSHVRALKWNSSFQERFADKTSRWSEDKIRCRSGWWTPPAKTLKSEENYNKSEADILTIIEPSTDGDILEITVCTLTVIPVIVQSANGSFEWIQTPAKCTVETQRGWQRRSCSATAPQWKTNAWSKCGSGLLEAKRTNWN